MPTYDYRCRDCGTTIEVIHPMSEDGPSACAVCGGTVRRVLFPTGIIFKGSGFYRNDSRRDSASGGTGSRTTTSTPAEGSDSTVKPSSSTDAAGSGSSGGDASAGGGGSTPSKTAATPTSD